LFELGRGESQEPCIPRNISKTMSIVLGTNHSLNPKPQLIIVINNVDIEQVEDTKLFGVTLDCKLSCSKNIDTMVS
jgi:hypothetical protein